MKTKTKLTIAVASILSVAALAGTGYAGWVISSTKEEKGNGEVIVYDVTDNSVELKVQENYAGKIIWGKTANTASYDWFGYENVEDQNFNPSISFTVKNLKPAYTVEPQVHATLVVKASDEALTAYNECRTTNLIVAPEANKAINIDAGIKPTASQTNDKDSFSYTLDLQEIKGTNLFGWGTYFNSSNPIDFYNAHAANDKIKIDEKETTYFADASNKMSQINQLSGITFEISITADHAKQSGTN